MRKFICLIIAGVALFINSCYEPAYGIYFYNEYQDSVVLVEKKVGLRGEFIEDLFSYYEKYVIKPKTGIELKGTSNFSEINQMIPSSGAWYVMVYSMDVAKNYEDPNEIYENKLYLQLYIFNKNCRDDCFSFPPDQPGAEGVELIPPYGYYNNQKESKCP